MPIGKIITPNFGALGISNRLGYPGTEPGFDAGHIAAQGLPFSSHVAGGSYVIDLFRAGKKGAASTSGTFPVGMFNSIPYLKSPSSSDYLSYTNSINITPGTVTTAVIAFVTSSTSGTIYGDNGPWQGIGLSFGNLTVIRNNVSTGVFTPDVNTPYFFAASMSVAANTSNWVAVNLLNGNLQTGSTTCAGMGATSNGTLIVGNGSQALVNGGFCAGMYTANGPLLSIAQLRDWAADPWSYWFPKKEPFPVYVQGIVSANAYTLTAAAGSYTLSGQTASLKKGSLLTAAAGSYALTGQTATLARLLTLTASAGSYAVSGQDASLKKGSLLSAAAGAYTLTGQDVTLTYSGPTSYTLTADAGSYALSGQDASLKRGLLVSASAGSYSLSGQDAALKRALTLTAGAGSYSLSGQDAALKRGLLLSASAGSYAVGGQDIGMSYSGQLSIAAAYYVVKARRRRGR
jgi:hypothetical protein